MDSNHSTAPLKYIPGTYVIPELNIGKKLHIADLEIDVLSEKPFPRDKLIIGIMGSAGKERDHSGNEFHPTPEQKELGTKLGKMFADKGCISSNGAAWGLPYFPIRGAHDAGGYTMGISPWADKESHEKRNPTKHLDLVIYVGAGDKEDPSFDFLFRDVINTRYPDIVVSFNGRTGTLDENIHVLEKGGIFIPVKGSGGATDFLIYGIEKRNIAKNNGVKIIIPQDTSLGSLENAIDEGIVEAEKRWKAKGRTQNLFYPVIDELEKVMFNFPSPSQS